jgi:hypothetical protein
MWFLELEFGFLFFIFGLLLGFSFLFFGLGVMSVSCKDLYLLVCLTLMSRMVCSCLVTSCHIQWC